MPITFDSYPKEDGLRKTEYGKFIRTKDKEIGFEHIVHYDKGITSDHVIASGSYPVNFDFSKIEVDSCISQHSNRSLDLENRTDSSKETNYYEYKKELRHFWDGGLLSNTPLMQLVFLHRQYWYRVRRLKDSIPRLGVCIVNLHPKKQEEIPIDRDGVINRNNDIIYSDRTHQEENMLLVVSDYIDIVKALLKVSKDHGVKDVIINNLLNQKTRYHGEFLKARTFLDIIEGRFQIDEIVNINRENDEHTISNKSYDFSVGTIKQLLELGYSDARKAFKDYIENLARSR
jgi:NTE family protein